MSYQTGGVANNQWQPHRQSGGGGYYYRDNDYGGNVGNRGHVKQNQANQQTTDFRNTRQQDANQYSYQEERWTGEQRPERFDRDPVGGPSHRYPQTFEDDQNQRSRPLSQDRPYGSENDNFNSNRNSANYHRSDPHSRDSWMDNQNNRYPSQYQPSQPNPGQYGNDGRDPAYNAGPQRNHQQNYADRSNFRDAAPERYRPPDGSNFQDNYDYGRDSREDHRVPPISGERSNYGQSPQRRHNDSSYSYRDQSPERYGNGDSYQHEQSRDQNIQANQSPGDFRNHPYGPRTLDPPRIVANTSGSTPVFGVVAKNDPPPPDQYHDSHQISPSRTQHQPVVSPTKDYPPSFDQYRGNESGRRHNQQQRQQQPHSTSHQYRNALTPISEKASPTSSIGSKGQQQDNISNMPTHSVQNQYGPSDHIGQSWGSRGRENFPDQRPAEYEKHAYGQSQHPQQERAQSQYSRPGYRDFDASSGYASESTHNTAESAPNETFHPQDKNPYSSQFPPPPPEIQRENWPDRANDSYDRPPPQDHGYQGHRYNDRGPPPMQGSQYDHEDRGRVTRQYGQDSYGPPVQVPGQQDGNFQPSGRYDAQGYQREQPNRYRQEYSRNASVQADQHLPYHPPHKPNINRESGVEESHVPGVQAARNMFEKRSDPRRPPPAPKPILAPKPNNVNARPVPPRPSAIPRNVGWDERNDRNQFLSEPYSGPRSPRSPPYSGPKSPNSFQTGPYSGPRSPSNPQDFRRQPYSPKEQPSYSQSMENLDDRSRYFSPPPSHGPSHTQSLQNLDVRSTGVSSSVGEPNFPRRERVPSSSQPRPNHGEYPRNELQQQNVSTDDRPLVVAVKFNQESGVSLHAAKDRPRRHDSWNDSRPGTEPPTREPSYQERDQRQNWSANNNAANRQSYRDEGNWSNYPSNQVNERPAPNQDGENYVPDVVARSYELARQSQQIADHHAGDDTRYSGPPKKQNYGYDDTAQGAQNYRNTPDHQSSDRWPTPPPPIAAVQSHPPRQNQFKNAPPRSEEWPRSGPPQQHSQQHQSFGVTHHQSRQTEANPSNYAKDMDRTPSQTTDPPQQNYHYDSDSSEIDVDAPTPPPSKNRRPATTFDLPRGHSSYDRNKPIPINSRDRDDSWRIVGEQPPSNGNRQRLAHSHQQQHPAGNGPSTSRYPPQKPQRNSTSLSPRLAEVSLSQNQESFDDFDVNMTQPLRNQSSREKARLGKSGALANRKPPSRHGSASNLTEIADEGNFQIEVTDSDLSSTNNKMEVHRMESMRILHNETGKKTKDSGAIAAGVDLDKRQKSSQKSAAKQEVKTEAKKADSKLFFKKPAGDAAKTIPMSAAPEAANQQARRPPTYLGFGHTVEKPKADLLSQFKSARDSAMRTAAEKQDRALKSVSALVKFNQGKKETKKQPQPKPTAAEKNAMVLSKMNIEVSVPPDNDDDRARNPYHRHGDGHVGRNSTRSSSTVKPEKYDGDDDTTNGSRHERDRHDRGRDRRRDDDRAKSRGRSTSRGRDLSPAERGRGRSSSRGRGMSPERRRGRSTSRGRNLSPERRRAQSRHRSKSRERSLSPDDRYRPRVGYGDGRYDDRRRRDDESSYRRSNSPDHLRYNDRRYERMPPHHHHHHPGRGAREPEWVEQFRRGREGGRSSGHQTRRAWVNDPRRVEVGVDGRRRELDMDAFERDVKKATSYNSDFEQPPPRRQMIPSKLSAKGPPNSKRKPPPNNWMADLKERNKMAASARFGRVPRH